MSSSSTGDGVSPPTVPPTVPPTLRDDCRDAGLDQEVRGQTLELFVNRPERRNALTPRLVRCLSGVLRWAGESGAVRSVLLSGRGLAFCAGYDIGDIGSDGDAAAGRERDLVNDLAADVQRCPVPVVAAVNGPAVGGGCDLAAACDIRLGSTAALFAMPPARLGLLYAADGMRRLVLLAGLGTATEMFLTGNAVDAARAERVGLLTAVLDPDELLAAARKICARLAANAPLSVAGSKRVLALLTADRPWTDAERAELEEVQRRVWHSDDAREGPRAYRERRSPHFTGR